MLTAWHLCGFLLDDVDKLPERVECDLYTRTAYFFSLCPPLIPLYSLIYNRRTIPTRLLTYKSKSFGVGVEFRVAKTESRAGEPGRSGR